MRYCPTIAAVVITLALFVPQTAAAQFGGLAKKLTKKVEDAVVDEVEERAERAVDEAIKSVVSSLADDLEASVRGLVMSSLPPEPAELGDIQTGSPDAPFVSYRMPSRLKMGGGPAESFLARFGAQDQKISVHGDRQRTDVADLSDVLDAENARRVDINHDDMTYYVTSFAELMKPAEAFLQNASEMSEDDVHATSDRTTASIEDMKASVKNTGKKKRIRGAESTQSIIIVEGQFRMMTQDEDGEQVESEGRFYTVVDQWHSTDLAGYNTVLGFQKAVAESFGEAMSGTGFAQFAGSFGSTPYMQESAFEALEKRK